MKGCCNRFTPVFTRRELLRQSATGFGWLALTDLLAHMSSAATLSSTLRSSDDPLAPKPPQFPARAKRVIFLFMHGGPSHVDTFDYKPLLDRDDGKPLPFDKPRVFSGKTGNLLKSPWKFKQHGESGAWMSELFPHLATCADDLCIINSMHGSNSRHGGALLELHTGTDTFVRPSLGSWITYGLGTENQSMPGYITICPTLTHGGSNNWSSAFLPAAYEGTPMGNSRTPSDQAKIPFITRTTRPDLQQLELEAIQQMNRESAERAGADASLEGRINAFELAFRMQTEAPDLQDISDESPEMLKMYGLDNPVTEDFGRQCLMARRFSERGVRFVQCSHSYKWDQHVDLKKLHARNALEVDQPITALLNDLKSRGMLDETLVLWGGEFGRTPVSEDNTGRDHNPEGFTMWMAGGGVKAGQTYGATDDYGYFAQVNKVHFHDLHATMLHLLGFDHLKLTYRHGGRDFRLTDVHGNVIYDLIA